MFKKILKWVGRVLLGLVLLAVLFHVVENIRGKRAWEQYKRECAARGESIEDWQSLLPPPIPDEDNIAMAPIFRDLFADPPRKRLGLPVPQYLCDTNTVQGLVWQTGRYRDLDPWRVAFSNDNLLAALSVYDDDLRKIEEALKRPAFRHEGWDKMSITNHVYISVFPQVTLVDIYTLLAQAKYEAGQHEQMLKDIQTGFRIASLCQKNSIFSDSAVVWMGAYQWMCEPLWFGISAHVWDAQQLATLQNMLKDVNLTEHIIQANQLGCSLYTARLTSRFARHDSKLYWFAPRGHFYRLAIMCAKIYERQKHRIHTDDRWFEVSFFADYKTKSIAFTQATLHQATIACAIERYRLEHGRIPERLDGLVPQFLAKIPCDPCDGQPMRYKLADDGEYILYSIGWNGVDEGGRFGLSKRRSNTEVDIEKGDWIWHSAPAPEAVNEESGIWENEFF